MPKPNYVKCPVCRLYKEKDQMLFLKDRVLCVDCMTEDYNTKYEEKISMYKEMSKTPKLNFFLVLNLLALIFFSSSALSSSLSETNKEIIASYDDVLTNCNIYLNNGLEYAIKPDSITLSGSKYSKSFDFSYLSLTDGNKKNLMLECHSNKPILNKNDVIELSRYYSPYSMFNLRKKQVNFYPEDLCKDECTYQASNVFDEKGNFQYSYYKYYFSKIPYYDESSKLFRLYFDPSFSELYSLSSISTGNGSDFFRNHTFITKFGLSLERNSINFTSDSSEAENNYNFSSGHLLSYGFYNSTRKFWNITMSIANSSGQWITKELCDNNVNCVGYWALDGNYTDSKFGNDGNASQAKNASSISSKGIKLSGYNDFIEIADTPQIAPTNEMTMSIWFYMDASVGTNNWGLISKYWSYSGHTNNRAYTIGVWGLSCNPDSVGFGISSDGSSAKTICGNATITPGEWHHAAATFEGSTKMVVYIDGQPSNSVDVAIPAVVYDSAEPMRFGTDFNVGDPNRYFSGIIDEAIIFNETLTAGEINQLYRAGLSQHSSSYVSIESRTADNYNISDPDLVSLWGFNGNADDLKANNDGLVSGALNSNDYGIIGQGYKFDGNDYIDVASVTDINLKTDFSYSAWLLWDGASGNQHIINKDAGTYNIYLLNTSSNEFGCQIRDAANNPQKAIISNVPKSNTWVHVLCSVENNNSLTFYYNGLNVSNRSFDGVGDSVATTLVIGSHSNKAGNFFNGYIDEVRIYNKGLSAQEAKNHYQMDNYHVNWSKWQDNGTMQDSVPKYIGSNSSFIQFKFNLFTDDPDSSPYILDYNVTQTLRVGMIFDIDPPKFTSYPSNISTAYNNNIYAEFRAADENISQFFINDSDFSITTDGNLSNSSILGAGISYINVSVNDSQGNINSTIFYVNITQAALSLAISGSHTINYGSAANVLGEGCNAQINCSLYRDGGYVSNPDTSILVIGMYTYLYNTTGNANFSAANSSLFYINVSEGSLYNNQIINNTKWFNTDVARLDTVSGVLVFFLLIFLLLVLLVVSELMKIPIMFGLFGLGGFFVGILIYNTLSAIIGVFFIIFCLIYGVARCFYFINKP